LPQRERGRHLLASRYLERTSSLLLLFLQEFNSERYLLPAEILEFRRRSRQKNSG